MSTKEITLNSDKVIADFMEIKTHEEQSFLTGIGNFYLVDDYRNAVNFNSWSSLMPVIDKINNLGKEYNFTIHKTYCSCSVENPKKKMYKDFSFAHSEIKYVGRELEAAYKLVIKFLEWYNTNKNQ